MIVNIVDNRNRRYRFLKVNAIVEAAWHDNSCPDSDRIEYLKEEDGPDYAEQEHIDVHAAIQWAEAFRERVTLYLYDEDDGIYCTHDRGTEAERHPELGEFGSSLA